MTHWNCNTVSSNTHKHVDVRPVLVVALMPSLCGIYDPFITAYLRKGCEDMVYQSLLTTGLAVLTSTSTLLTFFQLLGSS